MCPGRSSPDIRPVPRGPLSPVPVGIRIDHCDESRRDPVGRHRVVVEQHDASVCLVRERSEVCHVTRDDDAVFGTCVREKSVRAGFDTVGTFYRLPERLDGLCPFRFDSAHLARVVVIRRPAMWGSPTSSRAIRRVSRSAILASTACCRKRVRSQSPAVFS
jgi:hypothetical protein